MEKAHFSLKIVPDELQRIVKCMNSRGLNGLAGLLFSGALHDSGEDLVRPGGKDLRALQVFRRLSLLNV